jgi:hypothetical protein
VTTLLTFVMAATAAGGVLVEAPPAVAGFGGGPDAVGGDGTVGAGEAAGSPLDDTGRGWVVKDNSATNPAIVDNRARTSRFMGGAAAVESVSGIGQEGGSLPQYTGPR